jgi:hypothetical protein
MTRAGIVAAHLGAIPAALVVALAVAIAMPTPTGVDVHLHDTFFVVGHFHATVVLCACVLAVTGVALRYGAMNAMLIAAWVLLVVHLASALLPPLRRGSVAAADSSVVVAALPAHPGLGYLYLFSALAGLFAVLLGLAISLWRGLGRVGGASSA